MFAVNAFTDNFHTKVSCELRIKKKVNSTKFVNFLNFTVVIEICTMHFKPFRVGFSVQSNW